MFCAWLKENLNIDVERNYNQSQGGADIETDNFLFEIKRRETLSLNLWWKQVTKAHNSHPRKNELIKVVAFRKNRSPWQFLISAELIGLDSGFLLASEEVFRDFAARVELGATSGYEGLEGG